MRFSGAQREVRCGGLRRLFRRNACIYFRRGADPTERDIEFAACNDGYEAEVNRSWDASRLNAKIEPGTRLVLTRCILSQS